MILMINNWLIMDVLFMLICVIVNIKKFMRREKNYVYCIRNIIVVVFILLKKLIFILFGVLYVIKNF